MKARLVVWRMIRLIGEPPISSQAAERSARLRLTASGKRLDRLNSAWFGFYRQRDGSIFSFERVTIMANYERTYGTARTIYTLLEAISWVVAIGGIVVCIVGISALGSVRSEMEAIGAFVGIIAGVLFALIGLISVAFVQTGRATVDQAEMSRDMLGLMRRESSRASSSNSVSSASATDANGSLIKS
ncbi:hypothetical protein [Tabrizicola sp.]|uniref:hypothetical protein n=1 Tax=Tabrizicola sp. TaxID=2005166 RepID=UPI002733B8CF|nr:hypothetical protein [Tabrizicola sp.]MDP3649682.1 hypothetical protein [Paracoccaceae bacterium]